VVRINRPASVATSTCVQVLETKPAFSEYLNNPTVSRDAKVGAIEKLFDGPKTSGVSKNLMVTMAANNRVGDAAKVADAYCELMKVTAHLWPGQARGGVAPPIRSHIP